MCAVYAVFYMSVYDCSVWIHNNNGGCGEVLVMCLPPATGTKIRSPSGGQAVTQHAKVGQSISSVVFFMKLTFPLF